MPASRPSYVLQWVRYPGRPMTKLHLAGGPAGENILRELLVQTLCGKDLSAGPPAFFEVWRSPPLESRCWQCQSLLIAFLRREENPIPAGWNSSKESMS